MHMQTYRLSFRFLEIPRLLPLWPEWHKFSSSWVLRESHIKWAGQAHPTAALWSRHNFNYGFFFCGWKFCSLIPKYIQLFLAVFELMQIKQYKIIFIDLIFRGWGNHANFGHRNIQWYNSTQFISVCNVI